MSRTTRAPRSPLAPRRMTPASLALMLESLEERSSPGAFVDAVLGLTTLNTLFGAFFPQFGSSFSPLGTLARSPDPSSGMDALSPSKVRLIDPNLKSTLEDRPATHESQYQFIGAAVRPEVGDEDDTFSLASTAPPPGLSQNFAMRDDSAGLGRASSGDSSAFPGTEGLSAPFTASGSSGQSLEDNPLSQLPPPVDSIPSLVDNSDEQAPPRAPENTGGPTPRRSSENTDTRPGSGRPVTSSSPVSNNQGTAPTYAPRSGSKAIGFHDGLAGWKIDIQGGTAEGKGSVTRGSALLEEGDSFLVGLEQSFVVPSNPSPLVFRYTDLFFDTTDPDSINDAFEASLVDTEGCTLVQGFTSDRDAFFNRTEDVGLAVGTGVTETGDAIKTVTLDLSGVLPGTVATIRFRLVNNDQDTDTQVRILDVTVPTSNRPPEVASVANQTTREGAPLSIQGSFTDPDTADTHTATINWGDGTSSAATVVEQNGSGTLAATHVYADNGVYTAQLTVTDREGLTSTTSFQVTVNNVAPTLTAGYHFETGVGSSGPRLQVVLAGKFSDPGFDRASAGTTERFTTRIDWGDGTIEDVQAAVTQGATGTPTKGVFTGKHTYAQAGIYTATVTVTDDDQGSDTTSRRFATARLDVTRSLDLTINNALPVLVMRDPGFDATRIDVNTVKLGPGGARPLNNVMQVRTSDVRFTFRAGDTGVYAGDTSLMITGKLTDGTYFAAVDDISATGGESVPATSPAGATKFFVVDPQADTSFRHGPDGAGTGDFVLDHVSRNARDATSNEAGDRIWVVDGTSLAVVVQGPDGTRLGAWRAEGLQRPEGIATDGRDIWIVDAGLKQILRYEDAAALTSGMATATGSWALHADNASPTDVEIDGQVMWVTDDGGDEVFVYTVAGTLLGRWKLDAANTDASGLTLDPTGNSQNIWVVDRVDRVVYTYAAARAWRDGDRTAGGTFALLAANVQPEGIADPLVTDPNDPRSWQGATVGTFAALYYGSNTLANRQRVIDNQLLDDGIFDATTAVFPATLLSTGWATGGGGGFIGRSFDTTGTGSYDYGPAGVDLFASANTVDNLWFQSSGTIGDTVFDLGTLATKVAVFNTIDHGPLPGEAIESTVYLSNDRVTWEQAVVQRVWLEGFQPNRGILWDGFVYAVGTASGLPFRYASVIHGGPGALIDDGDDEINGLLGLSADFTPINPNPPTVSIISPANDSSHQPGRVLVSGQALADRLNVSPGRTPNEIVLVTVNGQPVEVLDPTGNFFTSVEIRPGQNVFEFKALDAYGQTATTQLTLNGVQRPSGIDFSILSDVSSSFEAEYGRTSWHDCDELLRADLSVRNTGRYSADAPLLVGVRNISNPNVRVRGNDGVTPDGMPYFDLSALVPQATLDPGELTASEVLTFFNPDRTRFTYELVFLAKLNRPPVITTVPDVEAIAGRPYTYDVDATDPDADPVTFSLVTAPSGMTIDASTGRITWTPALADVGTHTVTVRAADGRGGTTDQRYVLSVLDSPPNRPPVFTSIPVVSANVNTPYFYDSDATDPDGDSLVYSVVTGPAGLTIDPTTGVVTWTPSPTAPDTAPVTLRVQDSRGGAAEQIYTIRLRGEPGNNPPVIVSQPVLQFSLPGTPNPATGNVNPTRMDLDLLLGQTHTRDVSITLPPVDSGQSFADIVFAVDESGSMSGEHAWLEQMVLDLDAALQARGIGPNRFILTGFGGAGIRQPGHLFNLQQNSTLTLFAAGNNQVASTTLGAVLPGILLDTTSAGGEQVLVLGGNGTTTGGYSYRLITPGESTTALTLGDRVSASIATIGEVDRYTFTLSQASLVYFDALAAPGAVNWTLTGPAGTVVSNRAFSESDDGGISTNPVLTLPAGNYTLSVSATDVTTGNYGFQLSNLTSATVVTPGTPVSGVLDPANETDLYRFAATAGDRVYLDVTARAGGPNARWRLIDPFGNQVFNNAFQNPASDVDVLTLATGTYTLLLEGAFADTTIGSYTINVVPALINTTSLTLGARVDGTIGTPGEQDRYTFSLTQQSSLYFDSLTNSGSLNWTLVGPAGTAVSARNFNNAESSNPILNLPAGDYTLTVDATTDVTGAYSFRLSDLSTGTSLTPGTPVSATIDPGNETDVYRFNANAGERFYFDVTARSGATATWRLLDPFGTQVFNTSFGSVSTDVDVQTMPNTGTYTLLIEGAVANTTTGSYTFNVVPAPIAVTPLTLGTRVDAAIGTPGDVDRYSFSLLQHSFLYFDSLSNNAFTWTLVGPTGAVVNARSFAAGENNNPVLNVPAGDYTLTVDANGDATGAYSFRLSDLSTGTALTPGTPVSATIDPGNETDVYRFNANAGERFYFDVTARSGATATWRLLDPFGTQVFNLTFATVSSDVDVQTMPNTGTYTLLIEGAVANTTTGSYTFNVVPAPIAVTPLTLGTRVDAAIGTPGDVDRYSFSLAERSFLYFDSLSNNAFTWTLVGPGGTFVNARAFNTAENGNPVLNLPAGDYTLTIDVAADVTGAYSFRLAELSAGTTLTPATLISSSLDPANETDLYRFTANAGERYLFDVQTRTGATNARWRLVDPFGNVLFNNTFTTDGGPLTLAATGAYTLLLEGAIADSGTGTYSFVVTPQGFLPPPPATGNPLTLGATTSDSISAAGEQDRWLFTLTQPTLVYFDSFTNSSTLNWSLVGPAGSGFPLVSNRTFNASDDGTFTGNPVVNLPAGDYVLTVAATGSNTGAYSFRLSDLSTGSALTPGTPVTGSLDPANETDLYRFNANASERFYFDVTTRTGATGASWRLIDPLGNLVFNTGFGSVSTDVDVQTLGVTGAHTLLLEGRVSDTAVGNYTFNVVPAPIAVTPLTLGTRVDAAIGTPGDVDRYSFSLAERSFLYFDSLTNSGSFNWTLVGPGGTFVNARAFNNAENTNPILNLPAGDYTLTVDVAADVTGAYSFRLSELASGSALTPGTPVSDTLDPANETDLYRFNATAGDRFFFDVVARAGTTGSAWRLFDPFGNQVFNANFGSATTDVDVQTLAFSGAYTLLLEGNIGNGGTSTYTINVVPAPINTAPLTLGNRVDGSIGTPGDQDRYTFTLSQPSLLYFDSLTNTSTFTWTLVGPAGTAVNARALSNAENGNPLLNLLAGDYTLIVDGNTESTGAYSFRLSDIVSATGLTTGTPVSSTLDPANETDLYQFIGAAGDRFYFDITARTGATGARWRLFDPYGNQLFNNAFQTPTNLDFDSLTLTTTGTFTLLIEGSISDTATGSYTFNVNPAPITTSALTIGTRVDGSIPTPGEQDRYTFTLSQSSLLYFDSLTNNGFTWTLVGPAGTAVNARAFNIAENGNPLLNLPAGDYTLTVDAPGEAVGNYSFRLSDVVGGTSLTPGAPISGSLDPANETDLYRFNASAGDRFFFDITARSGAAGARWRLFDPFGNQLFSNAFASPTNADVDGLTVSATGTYTLLIEGALTDTIIGSYSFNVQPVTISTSAYTLGSLASETIATPGEQDRYTFSLSAPALVSFDSQTNSTSFNWTLTGPTGTVVNARGFNVSDGAAAVDVFNLLPGTYTLTVDAAGDVTGAYRFRLSDLSSGIVMTPGTPVTGSLDPANETDLYRFTATAGDRLFFDATARTGAANARWNLIDPFGNQVFEASFSNVNSDAGPFTLAHSGAYTLLIEGAIADTVVGTYTFNVLSLPQSSTPLTLGATQSADIGLPAEQDRYTFSLGTPAMLYFDSFTNNANLNWSLIGPAGSGFPLVSNRAFSASDDGTFTNNPVLNLPAGDYTLTVTGTTTSTGAYSFRLLDLSTATALTPGTSVSGSLDPANETDLYRFNATAGDRFFFDVTARTGAASASWKLIDPVGNMVFTSGFGTVNPDVDVQTLALTGTFTLLVEGRVSDIGVGTYTFNVVPAPIAVTPLTLGTRVDAAIGTPGDVDRYSFSLSQSSLLYFDSLSNNAFTWTLVGPGGTFVNARAFNTAENGNPVLNLPAGDYTLTIDVAADATGAYSFRLAELSAGTALTPATLISSSLDPANETDLYRFTANAGERYLFDVQTRTGATNARWRLVDPFGNVLFNNTFTTDGGPLTLAATGAYTLLLEGAIADSGTGTYSFVVTPQGFLPPPPATGNPLTLGATTSDSISAAGEQDRWLFTLTQPTLVYFDSFTNSSTLNWSLVGPAGTAFPFVSNRVFSASDDGTFTGTPVVNLPAGDYVLTVAATGSNTGAYSFRLSDLSTGSALTPGTPVTGSLDPANETDLYRFNANAGERFYFDVTTRTGATGASWRLIDPLGNLVFNTGFGSVSTDVDVQTLGVTGAYTLLLEGRVSDTAVGNYTFNVVPAPIAVTPLTLGTRVDAAIGTPGDVDRYSFSLAERSLLYFDSLTNSGSINWTLVGPGGTFVNARAFNNAENGNPVLNLPAGDYTLTIDAATDVTGPYSFRLSDLSTGTALTPGTPVTGTLDPANETDLYRFNATAGSRFFFDITARTGAANARWRLVDPFGNVLFNNAFVTPTNADNDVLTLAATGAYTILLEGGIGDTGTGSYTFNAQPVTISSTPLALNTRTDGAISVPGEQDEFTFSAQPGARIFFDGLEGTTTMTVRLVAPGGATVFTTNSISNVGPLYLFESGTYRVVVDPAGDVTGAYSFRVLTVTDAPEVIPGQNNTGTIDPARESDIFRINAPAGQRLLLIPGTELFVGTAAQVSAATRSLEISGGFEDGYDGMEVGLTHGAFRPGAAINVVVITDEDRDILDPALNFANMLTALTSRNALLNAVNDATFRDPQNRVLLGVDSQSNGYLADGAGGFTIVPNSRFASAGDVTTKVDYVDLAWATTGAAWDLNQLRVGGLPAQSFTRAFVEIKAREIEEQLRLTVVSSDPNITFENLTGTLTGIGGGETATFTTRITGDGAAHSFDLLFVRPNSGVVLGSIPVTLNNDYVYPVRAVDADNDPITYRLLEGPAGATIDPTTGRLIWEPTQAGTFQFAVQADDGRGGRDTQSYAVVVTQGAANVAPTITSPAPTVATVGLPFGHQVTATDPDGDLLSYYLTQSPSGMSIDRTTGRITWTPTAAQIGAHPVSIRVLDGRGGSATQSFNMTVSADTGNRAPRFTSSPSLTVPLGDPYAYASVATDPDFDLLRYDLVVRPDGMAVDASTGRVTWRPTSEQIGEHTVILRVVDGRGGIDLQSFTVTVTVANTPPIVTSIPPGPATVGLPYQYQVRAQDADGDPLAFQLSRSPAGMTINGTTGLLTWTAAANQVGDHPVDVVVSDGRGGSVVHSFTLPAVAAPTNRGPTITSLPRGSVGLGERYLYQVVASDPDGDPLGYLLTTAPAGMTIDASTGLVTWEPAANQLGAHTVVIRVEDGRGGFATQTYTLQVLSQPAANQPPTITSTPSQSATLGIAYRYDAQATDPDGDTLVWSLDAAPAGASIDAMTGSIRWTPIATQLGSQAFTVRVADPQGAFSTQSFTVVVFAVNQGPNITSTPPTTANAGRAYTYAVRATDPDGDPLRYSLTAGPAGMIINQTTGVIQWTPQVAQVGSHTVTIRVDDGRGGIANQTYTVVVSASAVNRPPIITSQPPTQATADLSYTYAVIAADPDGDALMFSLAAAPTGMTIHPTTGVINWTPLASQAGVHTVTVRASDAGSFAQQTYQVRVTVNTPPTITRTPPPPSTVTLGQTYRYDVRASDPQGQPLNYQLVQGPAGMTIDSLGRITWTPTPTQLGNHTVEVRVRDPLGAGETLTFPLVVSPDTQSPGVSIQLSGNPIDRGTSVTILVNATDNVGVVNRQVTVNGTPVALDANGRATITMPNVGAFPVVATARDSAGNTGTATATLTVIDRTDVTAPFVELISPADEAIITAPTDVRGTVTDTNLLFYTLSIKPFGRGQFVEFARGTAPVIDGVLGKLDPSQLENDTYTLRLSATDAGGNVSNDDRIISVTGDLKLGNFTLSFTDLEVPVAGVPITLTRTYDTLRSNGTTDMGFGWRLDIRDTDLRTNVPPSGLEEYDIYSPFRDGTRVFVTLPGGKREGFTFKPRLAPGLAGAFLRFYEPFFEADKGVTSKLSVQSLYLIRLPDGTFNGFSSIPYNPASSLYGGSFTMTTKEGLRYQIDGATGSMSQVSDTNGNTLSITRAGIISSAGLRILFERDPQGRIVAVVDPAGNKIRYGYDARGDLVSVTDRENNVTRFEYRTDRAHYLDKVIDPLGRTGIRSEYDASGRLVKLIDAGGKQIELIHNPDNFTQTVKDQLGNPTFYEYDVRGNIITEIDAEGGVTRRTFDDRNNLLTEKVILASGTELLTQRTYDANGNVLNETDPLGNVTRNTYGPFNRLRTSTDALGNTTTNDINAKGNVLKTTDPTGAVTSFSYDSAGNPLTLTFGGVQLKAGYNLAGDLIRQEDGLGNVTTYTHDSNGNLKTQTHSLSTPGGIRTLVRSTDYNRNGDVVKVTDEEGGVTRTEYDAAGNKTAVIDARGNRTVYRYDERNKLIETIYPDATPADLTDNPRRRSEYDAAGREIARIDEMGMRTEYRYDKVGRLIETIYPDATPGDLTNNPRTKKEYDATGRVTATIDERGNRTEFQYDLAGNRTLVRDALGLTTITTYDAVNRESSSTDALGRITRYTYDAAGRQLETIFADGTKLRSVYDSNGRVSSRTDQLGRTTRSEYDARGLLKAVIDAKNQRTEYGYDEDGNLISEKDANGHITRYEYDGLNQRIATVLPLGQRSTARYDGVGNVINTTDFNGDVITYRYNERNMLVAKEFPNGSLVSFTYSPTGERETATDGRGTTSWEYDERSRLVSRTEPDGTSISYTYDLAGNRTSVTTPAGMTTYTFDAINRMTTVTDPQVGVTRYFYDNVSNVIRTERPNSTVETRQYDALNQLTFLENRNSAGVLSSYRYTLAANGRRDAVVEHDGRRVDYSYDELDRLTREQIADTVFGNRTIDYTYDPVANRLTRNDSVEGLTRYTYDNNDRLVTEELAGQITQYTHDANGNLVSKVSPTEQVFYDWDFENRLVGVDTDGDGTIDVTNSYDADGIRVAQTVGGQETRFLIDQVQPYQQVALEYRPSGLIVASYVHGLNLLSQLRGGVQLFYHVDGLGSVRALTDALATVVKRYAYDAFGRTLGESGAAVNVYQYAGEQRDPAVGLDYLRARYFDPRTGRFVSRDPFEGVLSVPLTLTDYLYGLANPVIFTDPSGRIFSLGGILAGLNIQSSLRIGSGVAARQAAKKAGCIILEFTIEEAVTHGIYIFIDDFGVYVGKSVDVERRLKQHGDRVKQLIAKIRVINVDPKDLRQIEQYVLDRVRDFLGAPGAVRGPGSPISNKINPVREFVRKVINIC